MSPVRANISAQLELDQKVIKCKDCGYQEVTRFQSQTVWKPRLQILVDNSDDKKDFRGTTSTTWRWRCKLCGYEEKGHKRPGITGLQAYMEQKQGLTFPDPRSSSATSVATDVPSVGAEEAQQVVSLLHHTMDIQRELDHL